MLDKAGEHLVYYNQKVTKEDKTMYEYEIMNVKTNERDFIYGYNDHDAWERTSLNPADWKIINWEYID